MGYCQSHSLYPWPFTSPAQHRFERFQVSKPGSNSVNTMCNEEYESGGGCSDRTGSYGATALWLMPKPLLRNIKTEFAIAAVFMEIMGAGVDSIVGMLLGERARGNVEKDQNNVVTPAWRTALWHVQQHMQAKAGW
ncbi:hypothetical protein L7F22_035419 [Adiantum nelumboides]|nr:hypothetical protein [Adiantum nelumboides]